MVTSSYRKIILIFLALFISGILLLVIAFVFPGKFIDSNINSFSGEERIAVKEALLDAQRLSGGSPEPILITARKVTDLWKVEKGVNKKGKYCLASYGPDAQYHTKYEYEALVREYTLFGLLYRTIYVSCSGTYSLDGRFSFIR